MKTLTQELGKFQVPPITPEQEREASAFEERQRREAWRARLVDAGIPFEFRRALPEGCPEVVRAYIASFDDATKRGLLLFGDWGTGKSYAASAILIQAARTHTVRYMSLPDMMREARTFKADALASCRNVRLLLLDDMGREAKTSFAAEQVYAIVDYRWRMGKPTLITTNLDASGLVEHFAAASDESTANAIVSRILGMCDPVRFEGGDRRLG